MGLIPVCCMGQSAGQFDGQLVGAAMSCVESYQNAAFPICLRLVCLQWSSCSKAKRCSWRDLQSCKRGAEPWEGREERSQQAPVESAAVTEEREVKKGRGIKSLDCPSGAGAAVVPNADSFPNLNQSYKIWNAMNKSWHTPMCSCQPNKNKTIWQLALRCWEMPALDSGRTGLAFAFFFWMFARF